MTDETDTGAVDDAGVRVVFVGDAIEEGIKGADQFSQDDFGYLLVIDGEVAASDIGAPEDKQLVRDLSEFVDIIRDGRRVSDALRSALSTAEAERLALEARLTAEIAACRPAVEAAVEAGRREAMDAMLNAAGDLTRADLAAQLAALRTERDSLAVRLEEEARGGLMRGNVLGRIAILVSPNGDNNITDEETVARVAALVARLDGLGKTAAAFADAVIDLLCCEQSRGGAVATLIAPVATVTRLRSHSDTFRALLTTPASDVLGRVMREAEERGATAYKDRMAVLLGPTSGWLPDPAEVCKPLRSRADSITRAGGGT